MAISGINIRRSLKHALDEALNAFGLCFMVLIWGLYVKCVDISQASEQAKETVKLFADNIQDAISFLKNDCTEDEYSWISEIIDDIAEKSKSIELIEAYKNLAEKYPEETQRYNIKSFIDSAMLNAESRNNGEE